MSAYLSKVGRKYGRLTVVESLERLPYPRVERLKCLCACGKEIVKTANQLHGAKSCGCLAYEARIKNSSCRKPKAQSYVNSAYHWHKHNAVSRGLTPLSRSDWENIVFKPCHYCGNIDAHTIKSKHPLNSDLAIVTKINGIDRLSSEGDYSKANSVPCCTICNRMKNDRTKTDFINHVERIINHLNLCQ